MELVVEIVFLRKELIFMSIHKNIPRDRNTRDPILEWGEEMG